MIININSLVCQSGKRALNVYVNLFLVLSSHVLPKINRVRQNGDSIETTSDRCIEL